MNKMEKLTQILKRLNSGEEPTKVKEEAKEFLATVNPAELSIAEQKLIDEGMSTADLQRLCTIHLEVLGDQVQKMKANLPPGHIISTFVSEHEIILGFLDEIEHVNQAVQKMEEYRSDSEHFAKLAHIADHLVETELHYQREEEILFPELEKRGVYGPPAVMREEHTQLRPRKQQLKDLAESVQRMEFDDFRRRLDSVVKSIVPVLREHIFKENNVLYPTALQVIDDEQVWDRLKAECDKIGYCCFTPQA